MAKNIHGMVDPAIFDYLQSKIDEDTDIRDQIKTILQDLEKHGRQSQSSLAKAHSTPAEQYGAIATETEASILEQIKVVERLAAIASKYPYYKYNSLWTRDIQNTVSYILFCGWLGGSLGLEQSHQGRLLTLEEVGQVLRVPINLKDRDAFHLTVEEYLHALISLVDELSRLAINAVIQADFAISLQVSKFIKDIHTGFQILNLKNDSLRRRSDSIKYSVKKVEDIVYDLSLRNLIPKEP